MISFLPSMEISKADLQSFAKRFESHWVSLVPSVFRRVFRSIRVGFFPLEKSPGGFCFQMTFRVRFPKPPWILFYTKILPVLDYCEPVSTIACGDMNRLPVTIHLFLPFTGIEPGVCFWVGHSVWSPQEPRCAQTGREEVPIRMKVMSRMIPTSFSPVGTVMASWNLMEDDVLGSFGVLIPAPVNAIVLSSTGYISSNIYDGHVMSAATFAMAAASWFSVPTAKLYWISQMVASFMVCLVSTFNVVQQQVSIYKIAGEMTGFGASFLDGPFVFLLVSIVFTTVLNTLEVCLQNAHMRILAYWFGIYELRETKEPCVTKKQSYIWRFKGHGLEPLQTTFNTFLLIKVMRKAFRSFIYTMIAFYKCMKRGLNRFYLLPVRLLLESRVTSTSSSKLGFNFLYLVQWLYLNGFMYHVSCKTFMQ